MSDYGPDWPGYRAVAWVRDLNQCIICGHHVEDGHHRLVQGMGGRDGDAFRHSPELLLSFCHDHHMRVHNRRSLGAELGYFLKPGEDPLRKPVWSPVNQSWFELTAGGTRLQFPNLRPPAVQIV